MSHCVFCDGRNIKFSIYPSSNDPLRDKTELKMMRYYYNAEPSTLDGAEYITCTKNTDYTNAPYISEIDFIYPTYAKYIKIFL